MSLKRTPYTTAGKGLILNQIKRYSEQYADERPVRKKISKYVPNKRSVIRFEMVLETSVLSTFNHLTRLEDRENCIKRSVAPHI
jgi:hypothetical protein